MSNLMEQAAACAPGNKDVQSAIEEVLRAAVRAADFEGGNRGAVWDPEPEPEVSNAQEVRLPMELSPLDARYLATPLLLMQLPQEEQPDPAEQLDNGRGRFIVAKVPDGYPQADYS